VSRTETSFKLVPGTFGSFGTTARRRVSPDCQQREKLSPPGVGACCTRSFIAANFVRNEEQINTSVDRWASLVRACSTAVHRNPEERGVLRSVKLREERVFAVTFRY
jgi:hypothetical protein